MGTAPISPVRKTLIGLMIVVVVLCCCVGFAYFADPYHFRIAPGVSVGQVDLSGEMIFSAKAKLDRALENSLYSQTLTVVLPEETLQLSPEDTQPKVDTMKAVMDAFCVGRWQKDAAPQIALCDYLAIDKEFVLSELEKYAQKWDTSHRESTWELTGQAPNLDTGSFDPNMPCQTLCVSVGYPEAHLDPDAAWKAIFHTLGDAVPGCQSKNYLVRIEVVPTSLPQILEPETIAEAICVEPVSDHLDMETYAFVCGTYGYDFDREALRTFLNEADYGDTIELPMQYTKPEVLGDAVYFRDLLGSCETRHTDNQNRNTNLRLLCHALDGHIVQPGEVFSYNQVVGERTAERGYKPAPAYSGNRLVDSIGGGVCQGSTTLYNCVLLADLEVVFRACHGAAVGYVPRGLDAAVNYLTTDFQFRNNWHFPIMLKAEVADEYVKMKIYGTDEKDYYIKMESGSGEDDIAIYARSYKCKYSKETDELLSRDIEAFSTYYKNIG